MATTAELGYGAIFAVQNPGVSPLAYVALGEVLSISPPTKDMDLIDATHMASPNSTREFIPGLIDPGECSVEMNYTPGDATDDLLYAVEALRAAVSCRITFPNNVTWTFNAILTGREFDVPVDDKMTHVANFKVTGSINVGVVT